MILKRTAVNEGNTSQNLSEEEQFVVTSKGDEDSPIREQLRSQAAVVAQHESAMQKYETKGR